MISEKNINQSLDNTYLDALFYLSPFSSQSLNENCSDFDLRLDRLGFPQFADQCAEVMYEGEKIASPECSIPDSETAKAQFAEAECNPSAALEGVPLLSRQSSLIEEWFGNINNTHPNDISVDSSLEALFANTEWQDFKVEMSETDDAAVTDDCLTDTTVYQTVNCQAVDNIPANQTVTHESVPLFTAVSSKAELQPLIIHANVGQFSSQSTEGRNYFGCSQIHKILKIWTLYACQIFLPIISHFILLNSQ